MIINVHAPDVFAHDGQHNYASCVAAGAEHVRPSGLKHKAEGVIPGRRGGKLRHGAELAIVEADREKQRVDFVSSCTRRSVRARARGSAFCDEDRLRTVWKLFLERSFFPGTEQRTHDRVSQIEKKPCPESPAKY